MADALFHVALSVGVGSFVKCVSAVFVVRRLPSGFGLKKMMSLLLGSRPRIAYAMCTGCLGVPLGGGNVGEAGAPMPMGHCFSFEARHAQGASCRRGKLDAHCQSLTTTG